ncbi:MAG: FeoA family protein [Phycisphaerae bacterium]|nr:FeoA family protein [Phycisphaerae bacterium]
MHRTHSPTPLVDLPIGTRASVRALRETDPAARRLMELGIVPGAAIELTGYAPLGGAIRVRLGGHQIALRREEAALIEIRVGGWIDEIAGSGSGTAADSAGVAPTAARVFAA